MAVTKRRVWVVEMRLGKRWEACASASLTRDDARVAALPWKKNNPYNRFRAACYVPREKA